MGQCGGTQHDPALSAPSVTPDPLAPSGSGVLSMTYTDVADYEGGANSGGAFQDVVIVICFSNVAPTGGAAAVTGSIAGSFDWLYDGVSNCVQGTQNSLLPAAGGTIDIAFDNVNDILCPTDQMGYNANITPPGCMNGAGGNVTTNDNTSAFACVDTALPVELAEFEAEWTAEGDAELTWSTATESDNDRFEIERSFDGFIFNYVGEVAGAGTSQIKRDYVYQDEEAQIHAQNAGIREVYYRLKQVDYDGTASYSNIELLSLTGKAGLQVISVEFGGIYRLKEAYGEGIERVDIYNAAGQLQSSKDYGRTDVVDLDTRNLGQGVYMLVINETYRKKLIVAR